MPSIVRKCCSASTSVGAISAPCRPASTARRSVDERDDRLARADVALEQTLHRHRRREVGVDLADRPFLRVGERERKHVPVAAAAARRRRQRVRRRAARARQPGGPARAGARAARRTRGAVARPRPRRASADDGARRARRREAAAVRRRRAARAAASPSARASSSAAPTSEPQLLLGQRLARRVDGRVVGRLGRLAEVVALDLEAVAVRLPAQPYLRADSELCLEPRLVEPRRPDLARVVGDPGSEDPEPAAAASGAGASHDSLDHGLLLAEEVANRPLVDRALVPPWPMPEEIADRAEAEMGEPAANSRADLGSVSTPAARASGRGALRVRGQRDGESAPAKPTGSRVVVRHAGHRTEYRTGTGAGPGLRRRTSRTTPGRGSVECDRVVLEPEEADRARAGMRPDDSAEALNQLDLGLRPQLVREGREVLDPLRRVGVGDRDTKPRLVLRRLGEHPSELLQRLLATPYTPDRSDDAVGDREDRLHAEERPGERLSLADASSFLQVLQRPDREHDPVLPLEAVDQLLELGIGRAGGEPPLDRERQHPDCERRGLRVDQPHPVRTGDPGGLHGRLVRARQLLREVKGVDPVVPGEILVRPQELPRGRLRGRGKLRRRLQSLVEVVARDAHMIEDVLVAEEDVQWHDAHVREAPAGIHLGVVGGRVQDDRRVLRGQVHGSHCGVLRPHEGAARLAPTRRMRAFGSDSLVRACTRLTVSRRGSPASSHPSRPPLPRPRVITR